MTTDTDIKEYKSTDPAGKIVKTVPIPGQDGKQIKIEEVSLQLASGKKGIVNNTLVSINGTEYAAWIWKDAKYSDIKKYNNYPHFVDAGKDAVITWEVGTGNKQYTAKIKNLSYTYLYVDAKPVVEKPRRMVVAYCESQEEAEALVKKISGDGVEVYIKQSSV